MGIKIISKNRKAFHDYEIGEKLEAGLVLVGTEVKALRLGKVNLSDGWIDVDNGEAYLKDAHIGHYTHGNRMNHEEQRTRKLLLKKTELAKLGRSMAEKGYAIVPTMIYFKDSRVKLEIALAKGKKLHDKRQTSKAKDANREMARALKS